MNALAIGEEVNLSACTSICWVAACISRTTASVAPLFGEKYMATRAGVKSAVRASWVRTVRSPTLSASAERYREVLYTPPKRIRLWAQAGRRAESYGAPRD